MNATVSQPMLCGEPIRFVGTAAFNEQYGGLEAALYVSEGYKALQKHPHDMLVFENDSEDTMIIRSAGYRLGVAPEDSYLDEKTIVMRSPSLPIRKFWLKVDRNEENNGWYGTFLFPEDY